MIIKQKLQRTEESGTNRTPDHKIICESLRRTAESGIDRRSDHKIICESHRREADSGTNAISVQVIRSSRKTMALQIKPDLTIVARVPRHTTDEEVRRFIEGHRHWIIKNVMKMAAIDRNRPGGDIPPWQEVTRAQRDRIKEKIADRVRYYSGMMRVTVGRISVRDQKTRWGSCSAKGNVNFNYRLFYMPEELLDYVVVHELAHRKHMNHSPAFWAEVARYCPDYKNCRKALKMYDTRG